MCGIVAALGSFDPRRFARAVDALAARGPDGVGVWTGDAVALGHRRLAVMDPRGGGQPLANEDGSVRLVVNGELYGTGPERAALEARGHRFRTRLDSEVLLHLYEEHGEDAVARLRGEFAFVLWDERRALLLAARDRFGVKPLAFCAHEGALWLASKARALFAAGVPAAWDEEALFQAASAQYTLPGTTLFRGVRQLPAGHLLRARGAEVTLRRYWDLDYAREADTIAPAEPTAEFRALFEDAVRTRLVADVPVAFQLSGGIDSSAVAAVASEAARTPIDCFTVAFDEAGYDEAPLAREVAAALGARLHLVPVDAARVVRELPAAVAAGEGLVINGHAAAKHALSRAMREAGFTVALTGEGADEVLAGYAHLRADLGAEGLASTNAASRGIMLPDGDALPLDAVAERLGYVPTWIAAKATFGHRVRGVLARDWAASFTHDPFAAILASVDVAGQLAGRGRVEQSSYLWSKLALEGYILRTLGDGMEMAHGVEGRLPFLDHELFAWVRRVPTTLKIERREGRTLEKALLRRAMEGRLPRAVLERQKHPFLAPPLFRAGTALPDLLLDLVGGVRFFDRPRVEALVRGGADRTATDPVLFFLLSACLLQTSFGL